MRKLHEELKQKEERILFPTSKVDKNKMQDAEMAAEIQSLQAGEERRDSNASHTGDCCLEALWQQLFALEANGIETCVQRLQREMGAARGQMPGREEGRRSSEDNQEQDKTSKQLALSASSECNEGTPANSLELDLPRVRGALVKAEEQGSQVQQRMSGKYFYQLPQVDVPWMRKKMLHSETCEGEKVEGTFGKKEKEKEKRNSQGMDPRTFKEPVGKVASSEEVTGEEMEEKEEEHDKKKKVKKRRSGWWKTAKERIAKFFAAQLKEGE